MSALYRVPFGVEEPDKAIEQYASVLAHYSAPTLDEGWKRVLASYKKRDWPSIPEIVIHMDAIDREARAIEEARMRVPSLSAEDRLEHSKAQHRARERADALKWALWRLRNNMELTVQNGFAQDVIDEARATYSTEAA